MSDKKTLLSGVQPSGAPHIGNYFGAMRQFLELQESHSSFFMIADYHALTSVQDKEAMQSNIRNVTLDFLAIGLDPKKAVIFKQSDVSEHTELAWIFNCLTSMPYLMRAHAFKDAEAKNKELSVGKFTYPLLMAADILLYDTDVVPVGADQKQHIEYTRDTAEKFNRTFGEIFKLPEPLIREEVAVVLGTDGQKMSKSYGNTIPLFGSKDEVAKAVMSIVTDSSGERPENVYAIHKLFRPEAELTTIYGSNVGNYKALKESLIEDVEKLVSPMRKRRADFGKDDETLKKILKDGAQRAKAIAAKKMSAVRELIGVTF